MGGEVEFVDELDPIGEKRQSKTTGDGLLGTATV